MLKRFLVAGPNASLTAWSCKQLLDLDQASACEKLEVRMCFSSSLIIVEDCGNISSAQEVDAVLN